MRAGGDRRDEAARVAADRGEGRPELGTGSQLGAAQRVALAFIRVYQAFRAGGVSPCRFHPTCSAYAAEAIGRHGLWWGGRLALRRLSRCHPFGGRGIDLVPVTVDVDAAHRRRSHR